MYWKIWHDAFWSIQKNNPEDYQWMSVLFMAMGNALNILSLLILFSLLYKTPILLFQEVQFVGIKPIDSLIKFFLQFLTVPLVINLYYLKKLKEAKSQGGQKGGSPHGGKLFISYIFLSILGVIVSIALAYFLK